MKPMQRVTIQTEDFDLSSEIANLRAQASCVGAVCSFDDAALVKVGNQGGLQLLTATGLGTWQTSARP